MSRIKLTYVIYLSQQSEKEMRIPHSKSKWTGKFKYKYEHFIGAYFLDGKTCITNRYWAIEFNEEIHNENIIYAPECKDRINLVNVSWNNDFKEVENFQLNRKSEICKIKNTYFNTRYVRDMINSLHNTKLYIDENCDNSILQIVGDEGRAVICPLKKKEN